MARKRSPEKEIAIRQFEEHVSRGKVAFFRNYGMDFVMGRREGPYLYDLDGEHRLFNLHCNGGVFNLGHRNPELSALLKETLDDLDIGNHHLLSKERAECAALLAELLPGDLNYTVFGVGGGEAVDLAIKVARGYTGKHQIISAKGGYHGHTGLALAAGDETYRKPFGPSFPGFYQVPFGDLEALRSVVSKAETAAVILETIPATLGIVIPSREYLQGVRELCDERETLLIIDEVQTGLGRTGKLWAFEHFDILPDIVVIGKGLSGGLYPITATVLREPLVSVFDPDPFIHISTFGGAEIGCRLAKRVLEISSTSSFLEHVNHLAEQFRLELQGLQSKHKKHFLEVRQLGLMMGLKLNAPIAGPVLTKTAFDHGLLLVYANNDPSVCQCLPPLNMNPELIPMVMEQLDSALAAARKLLPLVKVKRGFERFRNRFRGANK
ncbi:MAG: aspartate aminotransferase family protein [Fidelibacterota bacterium]